MLLTALTIAGFKPIIFRLKKKTLELAFYIDV